MSTENRRRKSPIGVEFFKKSSWLRNIAIIVLIFGLGFGLGRLKIQSHNLTSTNKNLPKTLDYSSVNEIYNLVKKDFDGKLTEDQVLDGMKQGIAKSTGDPYTEYFNTKDAKDFNDQLSGSFEGIGAELGKDGNSIIVVSPLSGYPADKAGLKPKDVIVKINDKSVYDITVSEAVKLIRGPKETTVKLGIIRNSKDSIDLTIKRAKITIPSVESNIDGDIGYLKISQFGNDTVDLAQKAALEFRDKGVKGVVVDLRSNPGGYLNGAVDISSLWLADGKKVVEERRGGVSKSIEYSKGSHILLGLPTVVLINAGSASASEITAGALKDNGAATLVGDKSFGKGSVQQVEPLPNGSSIKITIARWFTPKGRNIDKEGIEPDVKVAISDADSTAGRDPQKDKAIELVKQKL